ncbi:MAG: hypothetical protein ABI899_07015, partial [Actinomycetota bacterium]
MERGIYGSGIDEANTSISARQFVASAATRYPQLVDAGGALLGRLTLLAGCYSPPDSHGELPYRGT